MAGTDGEFGAFLWAMMTLVMVAILGGAMIYGIMQWRGRRRRPPPDPAAEERKARQLTGVD